MTSNELEIFKQSILDDVRVMMQTTGQVTQYIGARYVPLFADPLEWSSTIEYEPLTIVLYQGNSYTSRQFVPRGADISDESFWANTGNYNAQIEQYRQEVVNYKNKVDDLFKQVYKSYANVALMVADETISADMVVITMGYHSEGDGGGACYKISQTGTKALDVVQLNNGLYAKFIPMGGSVSPEQFGAYGDGNAHIIGGTDIEYNALSFAVDNYPNVVANGAYSISKKLSITKSRLTLQLNILKSTAEYALSIGNGTFGVNLDVNLIDADNNGVILETTKICGRMTCRFGTISARNGMAFNGAGGSGGVLDSTFNGEVWEGTTNGAVLMPTESFIGNVKFNGIRFTATAESGTALILDSSNGSLTQLFFPGGSLEPVPTTAKGNGILINVNKTIEHCEGYFRTTELTGKSGYIIKIKGNLSQQLPHMIDFAFDYVTHSRVDLSELKMSRYYTLESPIARLRCGKYLFASQTQANEVYLFGNTVKFVPIRKLYSTVADSYTFDYTKSPASCFEATQDCEITIPSWLMPNDEIMILPANHTVTVNLIDVDGSKVTKTVTGNEWKKIGVYRIPNLTPTIYAV